jgi:hypothetical protein
VKSLGFSILFSLVSLIVLFLSVLYMIAPRVFRRFVAWYSRADSWSSPLPNPPKETFISERVAGFFMTLCAVMMVRTAVLGLLSGGAVMYHKPDTPPAPPSALGTATGGILVLGIGAFFLFRPQTLLKATQRSFPDRVLSIGFVRNASRGGQVFGALLIAAGVYLLYVTFR